MNFCNSVLLNKYWDVLKADQCTSCVFVTYLFQQMKCLCISLTKDLKNRPSKFYSD